MLHGGAVFREAERLGVSYRDLLDFSANLNPFGCPLSVRKAMEESLLRAAYYPDAGQDALRKAIGQKEQVPMEWVYAGNGAAELIFRLCYAIRPKTVLVCAPSFLEYEKAVRAANGKLLRFFLQPQQQFDLKEAYLAQLQLLKSGDMAFLCNPNNPTGRLIPAELLLKIVKQSERKGVVLVVDECFLDFTENELSASVKQYLGSCRRLVVLKSFTKMYALAGIRIGYLLTADADLIRRLRACGQDWGISCVAQAAGIAACREEDYAARTAAALVPLRKELFHGLKEKGFRVVDGQANYLLFQSRRQDLESMIPKQHILIRSCANYPGLDHSWYRTAVRTGSENRRLLDALGEE